MEVPIFPLNGAVLFPGTSLPLNIFESRYIDMINYSFANKRHIGMIQTDNNEKLYNIGCVGKIHSFNETADGRYLISLSGINCFKVLEEIESNYSFRLVKAELIKEDKKDYNNFDTEQKKLILNKFKQYIKRKKINLDLTEIENIEFEQIIKFIAMVSPFKSIEKQSLLETKSLIDFYNKLLSIIELEIIGDVGSSKIN